VITTSEGSPRLRRPTKTGLTPELLEEIKTLLRRSSIRHGQAFRGMERGATAQQLATEWGDRTITYVKSVMRSVQYMLDGELPAGAAMSYENSFGYRELWEQGASPPLLDYVKTCLAELKRRNPEVKIEPTGRVSFPGGPVPKKFGKPVAFCGECYLELPCDCD
jgi:hypothetical protein